MESLRFQIKRRKDPEWWPDLDTARKTGLLTAFEWIALPIGSLIPYAWFPMPLGPAANILLSEQRGNRTGTPMHSLALPCPSRKFIVLLAAPAVIALALTFPCHAADEPDAPKDGGYGQSGILGFAN
jgi:hypothetical protein